MNPLNFGGGLSSIGAGPQSFMPVSTPKGPTGPMLGSGFNAGGVVPGQNSANPMAFGSNQEAVDALGLISGAGSTPNGLSAGGVAGSIWDGLTNEQFLNAVNTGGRLWGVNNAVDTQKQISDSFSSAEDRKNTQAQYVEEDRTKNQNLNF